MEDIRLPIKHSTSLAVLINELISNAIRYGRGDITLSLMHLPMDQPTPRWMKQTPRLCLSIYDEGPGFPEDFDPIRSGHTGLDLIESVSRWDLRGEITYDNRQDGGAYIQITFPQPEPEHAAFVK